MGLPTNVHSRPTRSSLVRLVALVVAGMLGLSACGGSGSVASTGPADRVGYGGQAKSIKVGMLRQPHFAAALFYQKFAPVGMKVEVVPFANATEIQNAVASGDLQVGVSGITAAMQGAAGGAQIVVVAAAADGGSAIVAKKNLTTVAALRGKKIGYVPGSAQDILLRLTLKQAGMDAAKDVQLVQVQFADMAAALERGDIDAFAGAETGPSDSLVKGNSVLVTRPYDTPMGKINIVLITNRALIGSDPALVQALVEMHAKATDYMLANVGEWKKTVEDKYGFKVASLDKAVQNIWLRWGIDDAYLKQINVLGEQQLALGQIKKQPDYTAFINTTFLQKIAK